MRYAYSTIKSLYHIFINELDFFKYNHRYIGTLLLLERLKSKQESPLSNKHLSLRTTYSPIQFLYSVVCDKDNVNYYNMCIEYIQYT